LMSFDSQGNIVRDYTQKTRIRNVEKRVNTLIEDSNPSVSGKVSEIVKRLNTLKIWNTDIADLSLPSIPTIPPVITCNNRGTVLGSGQCECIGNWNPATNCTTCKTGWTGNNCNTIVLPSEPTVLRTSTITSISVNLDWLAPNTNLIIFLS